MGNIKNQRFKKVCDKTSCPDGCEEMRYIHKLHRWCYAENYAVKLDKPERTRVNNVTSNVMTGTIWQSHNSRGETAENDNYLYEKNMTRYQELIGTDNRFSQAFERVAELYNIQANSLTASIIEELA